MLECDMKEKVGNRMKIKNLSYEVVKELLRLIYYEKVENVVSVCGDLILAAEKYDVLELKVFFADDLISEIKHENAIR
jgi:hypothetical protein